MNSGKCNFLKNETVLYAIIWTFVALLPLALQLWEYVNQSVFNWKPVLRWWTGMIPLILIFFVHNHILLPHFLKKDHIRQYIVFVCMLLAAYLFFSWVVMQYRNEGGFPDIRPIPELSRPEMRPPSPFRELPRGYMPSPDMRMPEPHMTPPPRLFPFPLLFKLVLAILILGVNVAISLVISSRRERENMKDLQTFRLQEELKYLKQQVSPHFLMNVLNNIHEMVEENAGEAQEMILELSHLLRYILYESDSGTTTLAAEAEFISNYVALMRRRYIEDTVKITLELPDQTLSEINIPPLLFVSFIENAFKHGVSYKNETHIDIKLCEMNGKIFFSCDNTIPVNNRDAVQEGGVGLSNVRRRLELLYGEEYSLRINETDERYSVKLLIPTK